MSKRNKVLRTVVIKNVSSEYETITIDGEESILYPNSVVETISDNPDKLKQYLENKYGSSLIISLK